LRLSLALIVSTSLSVACTQIPKTPAYSPNLGAKTCSDLARAASNRATEEFFAGTVVAVAGLVGVGAGIGMGPDTNPNALWHERSRYLMVIAPSAIITSLGAAMMIGSQETDHLRSQSSAVLREGKNEEDRFLYYQCVSARDDWSGDHTDTARLQIHYMKEAMSGSIAAQASANAAGTQSLAASSMALDAKTNALRASQVATASAEATKDLASIAERLVDAAPPKVDPTPSKVGANSRRETRPASTAPKSPAGTAPNAPEPAPPPAPAPRPASSSLLNEQH
jgi:hypothetical protein